MADEKRNLLDELIADIGPENLPDEIDFGPPVGNELAADRSSRTEFCGFLNLHRPSTSMHRNYMSSCAARIPS